MFKRILILVLFIWMVFFAIFPQKLAVFPELKRPGNIEIDRNHIYILDGVTVYVYSKNDYRMVRKFGKRGEGPGELIPDAEIPIQMRMVNGHLFLNSQHKVIYYSKNGKMLKEKTLPFRCMQIVPLGEGYAASRPTVGKNGGFFIQVVLYDARFHPVKVLTSMEKNNLSLKRKIVIPPPYIYLLCGHDRLFVYGSRQNDFVIEVFDGRGNSLASIGVTYPRLKLNDAFKNELIEWFKTDRAFHGLSPEIFQRLHFPSYLPPIRNVVIENADTGGDTKIHVQTYRQQNRRSEFFTFNSKGTLLEKRYLPAASHYKIKMNHETVFTFYHDRYYYLNEDPNAEEWELHME